MVTNSWLTINGKTYFVNASGIMVEGWYQIEGNYYYFYPGDGSKAVSTSISGFVLMQTEYGSIKILLIYRISKGAANERPLLLRFRVLTYGMI